MLDPKDWAAFRATSHAMLDEAIDYLENVRQAPAWRAVPDNVRAQFMEPLPEEPTELDVICRDFMRAILPYATGNIHPRFFGWVHGSGTPTGALADFLAAVMNSNVGGRDHGAVYVERQVIEWARQLFSFPATSSGVLTTGSSTANLIAVLVARTKMLGPAARDHGMDPGAGRLIGYCSTATHNCIRRAFEITGLGSASLNALPAGHDHRLDPAELERAIADDRARGLRPFMIIANAGSVDVGAIDPLDALADLAARENLWFHVDGAFGATAILAPSVAPHLRGIERVDSIAFDFHKWLHVPYDAGCVLVRDAAVHHATFAAPAPYLTRMPSGTGAGAPWFTDFTVDLSRGFRALKVWFTIKEHGARALGAAIEANVRQARLLGTLVENDPAFELLAPVSLNIVCFRACLPTQADDDALDRFNDALVMRLQATGIAVTSSTILGGRHAIRVNVMNHRTRDEDLSILMDTLRSLAAELRKEWELTR